MRSMARRAAAAALSAGALWSGPLLADPGVPTGIRIDQLQPASPQSAFFRTEGPHAPDAEGVEFAAAVTLEYGKGVLREVGVDVNGGKTTLAKLVDESLVARFAASVTPVHWLELDASLPVALFEQGDPPLPYAGQQVLPASAPGVGDLRLGLHFRPVDGKTFGFLLGGRVWAPLGSQATYLSDDRFRGEVDLGVAGELTSVLYGCMVSVSPGVFLKRAGDRVGGSCALYAKATSWMALGVEPAVFAADFLDVNGGSSLVAGFEPLGGVRFQAGGLRVGLAAGPGFGGAFGTAEVRGLFSVGYVGGGHAPPPPTQGPSDRDLDGIPDTLDACPDEAGPDSKDPKLRGCPAHDRDGDGVRDEEDFCPDRPGIPYPDPKANGCPDSDNDGLPDTIDKCPNEPGPPPSGCPLHVRLSTAGFKITPPIEFGPREEKLTPVGRESIDEVAATMRANPNIEQISVRLGTKGTKPALSDRRAQDILFALRADNLDSNRYEVVLDDDLPAGNVLIRIVR